MKAVILCGGQGSRLEPQTDTKPKPMIKVGGMPLVLHILRIYGHYGFRESVLCLGHKGKEISRYFERHKEKAFRVEWVDTGEKTLKGARIKRIENHIDSEDFLLTYGDGVADIDMAALVAFHRSHGRLATVTGVRPPSRFGELKIKGDKVLRFEEKPQTSQGWINGGFFVLSRKIFDFLSNDDQCDFEKGFLESLTKEGELMVYRHQGTWACVDTLRDLEHLNRLWEEGKAFWKVWDNEAEI